MTVRAELSSVETVLDELVARLGRLVDELEPAERDDLAQDLAEVERALSTARRRLARALQPRR